MPVGVAQPFPAASRDLGSHLPGGLPHHALKQYPFMRGMLVDEIQAIRSFSHKVRGADLPDQAQKRQQYPSENTDGCGLEAEFSGSNPALRSFEIPYPRQQPSANPVRLKAVVAE